jgi:hypothetical protein
MTRFVQNVEEKRAIGRICCDLMEEGEAIFLDYGTIMLGIQKSEQISANTSAASLEASVMNGTDEILLARTLIEECHQFRCAAWCLNQGQACQGFQTGVLGDVCGFSVLASGAMIILCVTGMTTRPSFGETSS